MPIGAGKYDDVCTHVRESTKAAGAIVIVIDGELGHGFSCQADIMTTLALPDILESMAASIRRDHSTLKTTAN
jgi:hypothetical protein